MGMRRLLDYSIRYGLAAMVALSLFLSFKIWTKPANSTHKETKKDQTEVVQKKSRSEVFLPTKLIYHHVDDQDSLSYREGLISNIQQKLKKFNYDSLEELAGGEATFQRIKTQRHAVELTYPQPLPLKLYQEVFELPIADIDSLKDDVMIDGVMISIADNYLYLLNHVDMTVYRTKMMGDFPSITAEFRDEDNVFFDVDFDSENVGQIYYVNEDIQLKKYSYIATVQPFTIFTEAFFNQSAEVYSKSNTENVELTNAEGEFLNVNAETGEINYRGKLKEAADADANIYDSSFHYVESTGNVLGNIRFFGAQDDTVIYRNYVEGFPVFGDYTKGRMSVTVQNQNVTVTTNEETLLVPIPSDETVRLEPTRTVLQQLLDHGADITKIHDLQIGYEWQLNTETKQVVDLNPAWYVKYDGIWDSVAVIEEKLSEGVAG